MYVGGIVGPEALVGGGDGALVDRAGRRHGHGRVDGEPRVVVVGRQVGRGGRRAGGLAAHAPVAVARGVAAVARWSTAPHCSGTGYDRTSCNRLLRYCHFKAMTFKQPWKS